MFSFKSRCYNGGNKHNFSPRYNEEPYPKDIETRGLVLPYEIRKLMYYETYLFDICKWCGKKINKMEYKYEKING